MSSQEDRRITASEAYGFIKKTRDAASVSQIRQAALEGFIPFEAKGKTFIYKDLESVVQGLRSYRRYKAEVLVARNKPRIMQGR